MILLKSIENENIRNHYYIVEHEKIRYLRSKYENEIEWSVTMEQIIPGSSIEYNKYTDDELEKLFLQVYRIYKLERILEEN